MGRKYAFPVILLLTAIATALQFAVFPCNEVPLFSVLTGAPVFGSWIWLGCVLVIRVTGSEGDRLHPVCGVWSIVAGIVTAVGVTVLVGPLMLLSHMCG